MTASPLSLKNYRPLYKSGQILCGTGFTVIATGWTLKTAIAKKLAPEQYAAIGNLYSPTRGISPLLRNLLANPQVRYLVALSATREDQNSCSCLCLADFFEHGFTRSQTDTGRDCWRINSEIPGFIDIEISEMALTQLRENVTCFLETDLKAAITKVQTLSDKFLPPWGEAQTFPISETQPQVLPGPRYGHRLEGETIAETWVKIIQRIKTTGTIRDSAYGPWQELIDLVAIVRNEPPNFYFPVPNYLPIQPTFIQDYCEQILADAPHQTGVKYTYGQRLRSWFGVDQVETAIANLCEAPNSARVVMSLWDVADAEYSDSPPCLNHIWVRIVGGELSLTATFRSNDMFSAWPANAMGLRALQAHIGDRIQQETGTRWTLGPLITVSQSAHIYSDCWEHAEQVIEKEYPRILRQRTYRDPTGSFVITLQNNEVVVEQLTPGSGERVNCFVGTHPQKLYQQIAAACPALETEHALYLGTELQKVAIARSLNIPYQQDRPLNLPT
ncbi:MAG: thymidylate synthase [Cyanobacteria bacterium P01_H01_bin.15]